MTRLTIVELRRLLARRLTAWTLLGALLVGGAILAGTAQDAKPLSAAEQQQIQRQVERDHQRWEKHGEQWRKDCLRQQAKERKKHPKVDFGCDQLEPTVASYGKPPTQLRQALPAVLHLGSYLLGLVAFLVGAGFVAAEFSTGSMGNWLTFEPRRVRVYASKLLAAAVGLVPFTAALLAVLAGGTWLICRAWGSTADPADTLLGSATLMGLRVLALTAVAGLVGAAVGAVVRHTAAVIGIAMGYVVLVEGILANTLFSRQQPWLVSRNIDAWVQQGTTYFTQVCHADGGGYSCEGIQRHLSFGHGALYLAVAAAAIALLAGWQFRRRDVV